MLKPTLLPVLLLAAGAGPLHAQTDYYARVGAMWASTLVRDVLVTEVTVQQSVAPMVALGASMPISPGYRAGLEATFASGGFSAEQDGVETDLGTLRTASVMLGLDGPIVQDLRWRVGLGGLFYLPSEDRGIFLEGGPIRFVAGGRRRLAPAGHDQVGSHGLGPLRPPSLHHRRAGAARVLPGAGREPGLALGGPGAGDSMSRDVPLPRGRRGAGRVRLQ